MWNKQRRTESRSDVLNRVHTRVLTALHPGTSLSNAFAGVMGYVVYRMMAWGLQLFQNPDPSVLREMDLSFIVLGSGFLLFAEYRPIVSELLGLAWGCCLCMLEVQALRRIERTSSLRRGLIAALYEKVDSEDNTPAHYEFRKFRRVQLFKYFCLLCLALVIGIALGAGVFVPGSIALIPSVAAIIFRKRLLARIANDLEASDSHSVAALRQQYRLLWQHLLIVDIGLWIAVCAVSAYIFSSKG